jgi:membrane fusion protein (multidrug efflux system)
MKKSRKKWIGLIVILAVAVGIAVAGYLYWQHSKLYPSTDDAYVRGDVFPVASRVPGTLATYRVSNNQQVAEGEVIATLDPRDFEQRVAEARAALAEAESALSRARAKVAQSQADLNAAESRLELAKKDLERFAELHRRDSIPRQRYDEAVAHERVAAAERDADAKALSVAQADLKVAGDRVKVQQTQLDQAELQRSYCTITAPVAGIVAKSSGETGQVVAPGEPLCAIVPLEGVHLWVEANFKETELHRIRVGQPVSFHTDVNPDRVYHGTVESISAGTGAAFALLPPENATGNWVKVVQRLPVRIAFRQAQNSDHALRLGLSVNVRVDTTSAPQPPSEAAR